MNTWLMTMFTVFIVESGRKVHHIIQTNSLDKSCGKAWGRFSKTGGVKERSFIWRRKCKPSGRALGSESRGSVWGERGGGVGRRTHWGGGGFERLEGKRKGHVYETAVWHFKLSALKVERHEARANPRTHKHTRTLIHMQTHSRVPHWVWSGDHAPWPTALPMLFHYTPVDGTAALQKTCHLAQ